LHFFKFLFNCKINCHIILGCRYLVLTHHVRTIWKFWLKPSSSAQHVFSPISRFHSNAFPYVDQIFYKGMHLWYWIVFAFIVQDFTARPDIADDCFLLASRCIRYCPQVFIPSTVFPSLVDCSMIGITVQHRYNSLYLCENTWPLQLIFHLGTCLNACQCMHAWDVDSVDFQWIHSMKINDFMAY
jgi:hypothetical protein